MHRLRLPRSVLLLLGASAALLAIVSGLSLVLGDIVGQYALRSADGHAKTSVDLLVNVGRRLPNLTAADLAHGIPPSEAAELDAAVSGARKDGLLSDLTVWDRSGRVAYSSDKVIAVGIRPRPAEVRRALDGAHVVVRHPNRADHTSSHGHGVLDAFEPLYDSRGHVFGAVETSLPLQPIEADAASLKREISLMLFAVAIVLWLLLMPFAVRAARTLAIAWVPGRRRTRRAVRRALKQGRIVLVYQPQTSPADGRCHAVEALVRMRVGNRLQSPDEFLPHIEGSSIDHLLCRRVIDLALTQLAAWNAQGFALRMSVNLSAANVADGDLPLAVALALDRYRCHANDLTLEITETGVLQDIASTTTVIDELAALGVDLSVDDFGTGHSSISRLHQLPVQEVKIDRSFLMSTDLRSRGYVAAMVGFASRLGLRVVAEGIEDAETLAFLRELDCDLVQGYFISRPLAAEDATAWLMSSRQVAVPLRAA
jgi:EAL domain-containing protein (putative c-di-GMP-specific phosphodiesterase class I)